MLLRKRSNGKAKVAILLFLFWHRVKVIREALVLDLMQNSPVVQWSNIVGSGPTDESSNLSRATKCSSRVCVQWFLAPLFRTKYVLVSG